MTQVNENAPSAPPAAPQWVSTQHEMEGAAKPRRTRLVRVKMKDGALRIGCATYLYSTVHDVAANKREHLYRVTLSWLAEIDPRDGSSKRFPERVWMAGAVNALQMRVLEAAGPDGKRWTAARLGPRGQIAADPKGVGLMSFLRAILVEWVAGEHPDAVVVRGSLAQVDVQSEADKSLRDHFFTRSGFTVLATADGGGSFHAPSVRALKASWNPDKVTELTPAALADALCAQAEVTALRTRLAQLEKTNARLSGEKRSSENLARIWLAVTLVSVVFALVLGIQPHMR